MAMIGHNQGPTMEPGESWRRHAWGKARARLLPVLPIEVLRLRVKRAAEIGLDYRTYASIRAASGHDVIGFLFSTNALRLLPPQVALPVARREKLDAIQGAARAAHVPRSDGEGGAVQGFARQSAGADLADAGDGLDQEGLAAGAGEPRDEPPGLLADRVDHRGVAVAQVGRPLPGHAVDVRAAVAVPHPRALAPHDGKRSFRVHARRARGLDGEDGLKIED